MSSQTVTLRLPKPMYELFKSRAERTRRSLEMELLEVVATAAESLKQVRAVKIAQNRLEDDPLMAMAGADDFEPAPLDEVIYR
jgi:hypothetical protein